MTKTKSCKRELRTQERRRQRKKLQLLMRINRAKGAQSVLNDDYGEEQKLFPHERLHRVLETGVFPRIGQR